MLDTGDISVFLQKFVIVLHSCTMVPGDDDDNSNLSLSLCLCEESQTDYKVAFLLFLLFQNRLLGWWSIDEGSREEQARLLHDGSSGYVSFFLFFFFVFPP